MSGESKCEIIGKAHGKIYEAFFFIALALLSGSLLATQTLAQQPKAESETIIVENDHKKDLEGQTFDGWVIPQKYWTNTREPIWLGGLQGKVTVIEFFRINCSHCQEAAPSRRALYRKYHQRGLQMVGFQSPGDTENSANVENDWSKVKPQIKKWGLTYPIAFDKNRAFFDKNDLMFYPTILVLDKQGIVRLQQTGYTSEKAQELEQVVAKLLKQK